MKIKKFLVKTVKTLDKLAILAVEIIEKTPDWVFVSIFVLFSSILFVSCVFAFIVGKYLIGGLLLILNVLYARFIIVPLINQVMLIWGFLGVLGNIAFPFTPITTSNLRRRKVKNLFKTE